MRYVAAYLLASLAGAEPSAADVEKILSSVGIEAESDKVKKVVNELKGKQLEELIEEGAKRLATISAGPVAAGGGAAPAAGGGAAAPAEEKKEEKKKEESDESDDDMGFGLFD